MSDQQKMNVESQNTIFTKYEQVSKNQVYRLAESDDASEEFDEEFKFRTCDISKFLSSDPKQEAEFVKDFGEALEEIGFAILIGHGVPRELYDETFVRIENFFKKLTLEEKMRFKAHRHGSVNQGYFAIKETSNAHPDLVEGWVFCRRAFNMEEGEHDDEHILKFWPTLEDEAFFRRVALEHEKLILPIMKSILRYFGSDVTLYDRALTKTNFGQRLNYYPPLTEVDEDKAGRMLGHEDMDMFTILPASPVEGLQVLNRKNMKWVRLNAPPGSLIINIGDYMQRITNNRLPSTTHRVSRPKDKSQWGLARTSIPFAVYLWENEILDVLPELKNGNSYPPIPAINFHTAAMAKYYGDDYRKTGTD
jgi:isopenicillin N synthase-like dioxygenase